MSVFDRKRSLDRELLKGQSFNLVEFEKYLALKLKVLKIPFGTATLKP
jgi:hypothetical protein